MMTYQISFDGPASAELQLVLRAVERQLHWHGMRAEAPPGTAASTVLAASTAAPCTREPCVDKPPHNPNVVLLAVGFVLGIVIGFGLCRLSRIKSTAPTGTR